MTGISVYKVTDGHFVTFLCIVCIQATIPEVTCIVNGNPVIPSLDLLAVGDGINHVSGCFLVMIKNLTCDKYEWLLRKEGKICRM